MMCLTTSFFHRCYLHTSLQCFFFFWGGGRVTYEFGIGNLLGVVSFCCVVIMSSPSGVDLLVLLALNNLQNHFKI